MRALEITTDHAVQRVGSGKSYAYAESTLRFGVADQIMTVANFHIPGFYPSRCRLGVILCGSLAFDRTVTFGPAKHSPRQEVVAGFEH